MKRNKFLYIALLFLPGFPGKTWGQCTPVSIRICGVADDYETLWVNGFQVGADDVFRFVHINCPAEGPSWGLCPDPLCVVSTDPALLSSLTATGNVIAAKVENIQQNEVFGSWWLDVACADGKHVYVASDGTNTQHFRQTESGAAPTCTTGIPPPGSGGAWTDKTFLPSGWDIASQVTVTIWSKKILDLGTGLPVPVLSYSPSAFSSTNCDVLYFRQTFDLVPVDPPGPPNFQLMKSILGPSSNIGSNQKVTFRVEVCNTGEPVSQPVTFLDCSAWGSQKFDQMAEFIGQNFGSRGSLQEEYQKWNANPCGNNEGVSIRFPAGFPGINVYTGIPFCWAVTFTAVDFFVDAAQDVCVRSNAATIAAPSGTFGSNSIVVFMSCASSPTFTPTPAGGAPTPTFTATQTPPSLFSPTPTPTAMVTPSFTFTPIFSPTATFTATVFATPTPTATAGFEIFFISKNIVSPDEPVSIRTAFNLKDGPYALLIYNSAGEQVRTLVQERVTGWTDRSFLWDGRNEQEELCASGVYVVQWINPIRVVTRKVLFIR